MPETSGRSFDVAVIGAGVIGLAIAWRAAQRGLSTLVLDRGLPGGGTSHHAAGMLAPVSEAEFGRPDLLALGLAAAARWPGFAAELEQAGGSCGLRESGTLLVARDRDEAEALERELAFRTGLGLEVRRLLPSAARALEPALAPSLRLALEIGSDHAADPRLLCSSLAAAAAAAGAQLEPPAAVASVEPGCVRLEDGRELAAREIVVAAGPWSGQLVPSLNVRPVKGQILRLRDPAGPGLVSRVLRFEGGYLVPRGDGRYVLGATVEERGFDTTVTALGAYELLRDCGELVPGILELELSEHTAGLRPGTPGNSPLVGRQDGLIIATGHYRNGVLLAPITAEAVAAMLTGEAPPAELLPFAPAADASAPMEARA